MEYIEKDKDMSVIKSLNKSIKNCDKEIENLMASLKQASSDNVRDLLLGEIENVQQRQKELKTQLLFEEANNMPISAREIRYYLTRLKDGNVNDINYRRMLINTFIYKIYLYDDKVLISYTTQEEKRLRFLAKSIC